MAEVADKMEILRVMERPTPGPFPEEAYICRQVALRVIGDHLAGRSTVPHWMNCTVDREPLWEYVSQGTRHNLNGPQLQALYVSFRKQMAVEHAMSRLARVPKTERQLEAEEEVACAVEFRSFVRLLGLASPSGLAGEEAAQLPPPSECWGALCWEHPAACSMCCAVLPGLLSCSFILAKLPVPA
jgi:hypothetical protein